MNRFGMFAALAAITLSAASCRLLPAQKAGGGAAALPVADVGAPTEHAPENADAQVPVPASTSPGELTNALSPAAAILPPGAPAPDLPFTAPAASVPMPGNLELLAPSVLGEPGLQDDANDLPAMPQPTPAAELRGLRSPKLPTNLPMSLDGKIRSQSSSSN